MCLQNEEGFLYSVERGDYLNFSCKESLKKANDYGKLYVPRKILAGINSFKGRKYKDNYFYCFVRLLSEAVSQDISNDWTSAQCSLIKPNMYIYPSRLAKIWGVTKNEAMDILRYFSDNGLISFEAQARPIPFRERKFFVHFNKFGSYIPQKEEYRNPDDVKAQLYNIYNDRGYIYFPANAITDFFFNKLNYSHGIKDIALLLYCNTSFQDDMEENELLKGVHIVNFGGYETLNKTMVIINRYVRLKSFAEFLHIPFSALNEMLNQMSICGYIERRFFRNKGTMIILSCLDNNEYTEYSINDVFDVIEASVLAVVERVNKVTFLARDFLNRVVCKKHNKKNKSSGNRAGPHSKIPDNVVEHNFTQDKCKVTCAA